jgi:acyl-ACP thioesterase
VEIVRTPEYKEELTVMSTVYGMKPMFGFRNTFIYDAEGRPCYKTWSMEAFVDRQTGKLKRVDDATIASMTLEPQLEMNYKDRRVILPKIGGQLLDPIKVLRADIDYNKHMNNANYVRIAMELLPDDFQVKGLRVEYRVAAKLGDVLVPTVYEQEQCITVALLTNGEVCAIMEFERA